MIYRVGAEGIKKRSEEKPELSTVAPQLEHTQTRYTHDTASRLATVAAGSETATYSYLANSPLVANIWFTNNTTLRMTVTKSYDYLNRLTAITSAAGGSNVALFNYANNTANQRTAITNVDSSRWVYQYDALGQVVSGKKYWSDGTPVAGQQFEYGFDDIGNRKTTSVGGDAAGANLRYASYTNNTLNQITSRDVPGFVNVIGTATNLATVTVWGDNGAFSATSRKGEYFRGELAVTNTANPVWLTITNLAVLNNGTNPDIVTSTIGKTYIPKTAEVFQYDLDGNLTNDGRWVYTWDAENRLVKQESLSGAPTASKFKLEFAYDSKGRRIQKLVSTNNGSAYVAQYTNRFVHPVRYDDALLLCLCPPERKGWAILYRLYSRFAGKVPAAPSRRSCFHPRPPAAEVDLLRGVPQSERCDAPGAVPENGLGQTLPQEPTEKLSHGVNDGWNLVAILNPQSSLLQAFTWGMDLSGSEQGAGGVGGLLIFRDQSTLSSQPSTNFLAYDGNGNVAAFVNVTNAAVTAQYEYGPFGEVLRTTGASAKANPFRFSTKYQDDESDYLYYGYRSYNPSTGRWLSRDPIAEQGGVSLYGFVGNNGIGDVDILGLRKTRFTLTEMEAMLKKSRGEFQSKLVAKCQQGASAWVDNDGNTQCCHFDTCLIQAAYLAMAFELKLRATFTSNFNKHGNVIAFDHHSVWAESINTRADKAPENGMVWRDFNKGFGLKCWGMQMLMRREFELVERPFKERKIQCFKGGDVGNHQKNTVASHHWFGIYIGTNTDKTTIDVLVDPWYSAGGIISPVSAGVSGDEAKYFDANALW